MALVVLGRCPLLENSRSASGVGNGTAGGDARVVKACPLQRVLAPSAAGSLLGPCWLIHGAHYLTAVLADGGALTNPWLDRGVLDL